MTEPPAEPGPPNSAPALRETLAGTREMPADTVDAGTVDWNARGRAIVARYPTLLAALGR